MLIFNILTLMASNAVSLRRDKAIRYARSAFIMLTCTLILVRSSLFILFLDKGIGFFHGLFHASAMTHIFHVFIIFISALILQLSGFYPRKLWLEPNSSIFSMLANKIIYFDKFIKNKMSEQYRIIEYPLILLFVVVGGSLLLCSSDLISVFLAIELQSYGLYLLCSVYRDSEKATSAGLIYFLLGGLSSCFILLGSAVLYVNSGNTSFDGLYIINNISNANALPLEQYNRNDISDVLSNIFTSHYISFSLIIMSIGFLFKITAAPFHFWSPDVYDAIPTNVTTFVAIFAKISIFILLLELTYFTRYNTNLISDSEHIDQTTLGFHDWTSTLLLSSLFSLIVGSILGLTQSRIKRLYAYSTISHVGFILLALTINSFESIQSFIFYLVQYSLSNLNAFMLLIAVGYSLYVYVNKNVASELQNKVENKDLKINLPFNKDNVDHFVFDTPMYRQAEEMRMDQQRLEQGKNTYNGELVLAKNHEILTDYTDLDKKNSPVQMTNEVKGYFYINPILGISLGVTIFSFVGIPPLVGFFAKQMVLISAINEGYVFMTFIAILTSVISACYYLALIKQIFFEKPDHLYNPQLNYVAIKCNIINFFKNKQLNSLNTSINSIKLSSSLAITISVLTIMILLFMISPQECLSITTTISLILLDS